MDPKRDRKSGIGPYPSGRLMVVLIMLYAVAFLDRNMISLVAPAMRSDLKISATQLGLLQGFGFVLFYSLFGIPIGGVVDRASRRMVIFLGVIVWSVSASAGGLANSFVQLLVARLGVGAGEAALSPAAYSMIADGVPRHRLGLMSTLFACGASIGAAVSVGVGGVLMSFAIAQGDIVLPIVGILKPWQFALFVLGLPGLILAGTIFLVPEPDRFDRIGTAKAQIRDVLSFMAERPAFFFCCFGGFALFQTAIYSYTLWVPTRLVHDFGWTYNQVGLLLAVGALLSIPGSLVNGRIVDRMVDRGHVHAPLTVTAICMLAIGLCIVIAFGAGTGTTFSIFLILAYLPTVLINMGPVALQMVAPNEYRGRLVAIHTLVTTLIGSGLGPLLPALLTDRVFHSDAMIARSVMIVVGISAPASALLLLLGRRPMERAFASAKAWRDAPS